MSNSIAKVYQHSSGHFALRFQSTPDFERAVSINTESNRLPVYELDAADGIVPQENELIFASSVDLETVTRHFEDSFDLKL